MERPSRSPRNRIFYPDDTPHFPELQDPVFMDDLAFEIEGLTAQQAVVDAADGAENPAPGRQLTEEEFLLLAAKNRTAPIAKYAPDQTRDDHGRFAETVGAKIDSPEFKAWFKDSKVVDKNGAPLTVYHGSLSDFNEFKTDPQDKTSLLLDRNIGAHFAEEPQVSNSFVAGEYAYASDAHISEYHPEESWYRGKDGEIRGGGIPVLVKRGADGRDFAVEPYDVNKHGSTWGLRSRMGDDYSVRMLKPGGHVFPVHLSIQNPLVVPSTGGFDQNDIVRAVEAKVFPVDKQLFIDATHRMLFDDPKKSEKVWDALQSGKGYEKWKTWDDFTADYGIGLLDATEKTTRAKQVLEKLGYDGIKYKNTSNNEVHEGQNPWTWIAFHPGQIKSVFNRTPHSDNADIGKSDEFEAKHPRDNKGEFVSVESQAFLDKIATNPDVVKARSATQDGVPTWKIYQQPDGSYEPNRQLLHQVIVSEMLNDKAVAPVGERPKAAILIGLPASGKTKVLRDLVPGEWTKIDADAIKEKLPEYTGNNAGIVHKESGHVAETMLIPQAKAARQNLMFDATGKNSQKMLFMVEQLKKDGYDVSVYHVDLPPEKAAQRAYTRFKESGRFVDPVLIINEFDGRPKRTYGVLRDSGLLAHCESWNNDVAKGEKPKKVDEWNKY